MGGERPYSFGKKLGIEKGLFQYYWQKGGMPSSENLLKIQKGTGCSLDWLLTGRAPAVDEAIDSIRLEPCRPDEAGRRGKFVDSARKLRIIYSEQAPEKLRALEQVIESFSKR
jgi:hypothetical protein